MKQLRATRRLAAATASLAVLTSLTACGSQLPTSTDSACGDSTAMTDAIAALPGVSEVQIVIDGNPCETDLQLDQFEQTVQIDPAATVEDIQGIVEETHTLFLQYTAPVFANNAHNYLEFPGGIIADISPWATEMPAEFAEFLLTHTNDGIEGWGMRDITLDVDNFEYAPSFTFNTTLAALGNDPETIAQNLQPALTLLSQAAALQGATTRFDIRDSLRVSAEFPVGVSADATEWADIVQQWAALSDEANAARGTVTVANNNGWRVEVRHWEDVPSETRDELDELARAITTASGADVTVVLNAEEDD